ncbi:tRNA pseudouridine synthase A [Sulfodiicoccus acidiphilus]|uniref:tRNA pseudouridine synthase A n=1 Tax=Sulfodiicoccus acidiphilus TaxID=1670455 RepID=A0A348B177_9CREN|nr:tRNA pseudouridine synthase A [Sulfodiicoccus acidiphilus]BBD71929.1 tRNA pseudouridine synthase A [Sulfodiicoccus acidiphilus]GGT91534.1 tRNA pseudouridine synthase A [Sulfodiicoccus acidiphilus]
MEIRPFIREIDDFCGNRSPWIVTREEEELPSYGKRPEERSLSEALKNSILIIDKPPGPTSHEVAHWIKVLLGVKKAGHGGTLEPS